MRKLPLDKLVSFGYNVLHSFGKEVEQETWQNIKSPDKTFEITNVYFQGIMPETEKELGELTQANLPWAEDHFQERVGGIPLNPGKQWENWPFYKKSEDDARFRSGGTFSHTYMERFWPKHAGFDCVDPDILNRRGIMNQGIRFNYGDYNDLIERAKQDNSSRQLYLSIWHPEDQSNGNGRVPCTLGYYFLIRNNTLELTYHIRSCDILRHFKNDVYMAVRLAQDFRDKVNPEIKLGDFNMWVGSLHCFLNEKPMLIKYFR